MKPRARRDPFEPSPGRKKPARIPFDFVLDLLAPLEPWTRAMFGCTAVYVDEKIVFVLRDKPAPAVDNGVWVATTAEHHESLAGELPSMRSITVLGTGVTGWQILPADAADFEESAERACRLVERGDPRIGKIPGAKSKKAATKKAPAAPRKTRRAK